MDFDQIKSIQTELNKRILKLLKQAVVFVDDQFIEWFTLTIGVDELFKSGGALNVKEFSTSSLSEKADTHAKAVFLVSQPLVSITLDTMRQIIEASNFKFVTIITSVCPEGFDMPDDYFDDVKQNCLLWMRDVNNTCDMYYEKFPFALLPTQHSQLKSQAAAAAGSSSTLFFLNPLSSWSSSTGALVNQTVSLETYQRLVKQEQNEPHTQAAASAGGNVPNKDLYQQYYHNFERNELTDLKALGYSLNEMLTLLDVKEDCFSFGILSSIVANTLLNTSESKQRRKSATTKASLVLIDRNLDLSSVALFHEETTLDKMVNLLPPLANTSTDVRVDLARFLYPDQFKCMLPGCVLHFSNEACRQLFDMFAVSKPKECLLDIYRRVCETFPLREKDKKTARFSCDLIKHHIRTSCSTGNKKKLYENIDFLQMVAAYCEIHDASNSKQVEFDKLISYVKLMNQNILDKDGPSVLSRLYLLFNEKLEQNDDDDDDNSSSPPPTATPTPTRCNYTIGDLVILLAYVYSLIGEECFCGVEEEDRIKALLLNELESESLQNDARFGCDEEFLKNIKKKSHNYAQFVDKLFQNLKSLRLFRKNSKQHSKLMIRDEEKRQYTFKPLLRQACESMVRTAGGTSGGGGGGGGEQLADIEYRGGASAAGEGLQNLFKSFKIGYLMSGGSSSASKPHPLNNDVLIIYVVGGITTYELKLVKEVFAKEVGKRVLVGSSHLFSHNKLIKYLLN